MKLSMIIATGLMMCSSFAHAQPCANYDASLGTFPEDQGWAYETTGDTVVITTEIRGDALYQNSMPGHTCPPSATNARIAAWQISGDSFEFIDGIVFATELKIIESEINQNCSLGYARAGVAFTAIDVNGNVFWIGFGEETVLLSNSTIAPVGPAVKEIDFTTTDGFHVYRVEVSGSSALLFIDNVLLGAINGLGNTVGSTNRVWIGDGTVFANSEFEIRSFHVVGPNCCTADVNGDSVIDVNDITYVLFRLGSTCPPCDGDANEDGAVDVNDLTFVLFRLGDPC